MTQQCPPAGGASDLICEIINPNNPAITLPSWRSVAETGNTNGGGCCRDRAALEPLEEPRHDAALSVPVGNTPRRTMTVRSAAGMQIGAAGLLPDRCGPLRRTAEYFRFAR